MQMHSLYLCFSAALLTAASAALAQSDLSPDSVETLLVTGSRLEKTPVAQSVVLDQQAIELRNSGTAADLLRGLPGLDLVQPGGPGGVTELFIRGAESNFALVTIDGIRVNDTTNSRGGSFDLSTLNPDDIERVEILKGPLSAIYGSDALAGALNIVTKKPVQEAQVSVRAALGSDGYRRSYLSFSGTHDNGLGAGISAARLDSGEPVEGSTSLTESLRTHAQWSLNETRHLDFALGYVERERTGFPSGSGGFRYAPLPDLEWGFARDIHGQLGWREQATGALLLDIRASYFKRDEEVDAPAIPEGVYSGVPAMTSESEMERERLVAHGIYTVTPTFSLAIGADYEKEAGRSDSLLDMGFPLPSGFDLKRTTIAAFVEGHYRVEKGIDAFVSTRLDKPEDHQHVDSTKVAVSYPIAATTRIGASWGDAFKLPSFYAVGDALVGNPDLLAETSKTLEIFLRQHFVDDRVRMNAAVFQSSYESLIDFDFTTFRLVNRDSVDVDGAELELIFIPLTTIEIGTHATYTDYSARLNGRPMWRGGVFTGWRPNNNWQGRLHLTHAGERPSASSETGDVMLEAYERLDLVLVRRLRQGLDLSFSLDNVLDKEYEEEIGFPAVGRAFRIGVSARL